MLQKLLHTSNDPLLTWLRVFLGVIYFAHGAQKALGWWGGQGFTGTVGSFEQGLGIPPALGALAILAEFLGGLGLIAGFLTRVAALGIATVMTVAIALVHAPNGFFMNWNGNQRGEGFEYHLLAIAIGVVLVARGAGAWSVDRAIERGWRRSGRGVDGRYREPLPHHG